MYEKSSFLFITFEEATYYTMLDVGQKSTYVLFSSKNTSEDFRLIMRSKNKNNFKMKNKHGFFFILSNGIKKFEDINKYSFLRILLILGYHINCYQIEFEIISTLIYIEVEIIPLFCSNYDDES